MSAIGRWDFVECCPQFYVAEPPHYVRLSGPWPRPGGVYQVREVGVRTGTSEPAIRLVGIVASYPGHPDCWWPAKHFRPIYRPSADFIEKLKQPVSTDELVTADGISHSNKPSRLLSSASGEEKQ